MAAMALLDEDGQPVELILRWLVAANLHLNVEAMIAAAGNWQMDVGDTWPQSLGFVECAHLRRALAGVGDGVHCGEFWIAGQRSRGQCPCE